MSASEIKPKTIVSTKQEVINILKDNLDNFASFGVTEVGLFGSFVREEQTIDSDVDLLVNLHNHDWDNFCNLIDFAETLFKGRKVDIIAENPISGYEGVNICREVEYVN
ncbi:MAG: nucleotidyltransferase domain-containing protein [Cyanobacteriota bacterium]|nr:nucleotidyltransferase domain-containing protein [Cyanobacteriota bacterium]